MRPASLRRFRIAVVTGGLLLASGAFPGLASDAANLEGTPTGRVTSEVDRDLVTEIRALVSDGGEALARAAQQFFAWSQKVLVPPLALPPVPVRPPVGVIVDDGAPF